MENDPINYRKNQKPFITKKIIRLCIDHENDLQKEDPQKKEFTSLEAVTVSNDRFK